MTHDSYASKTLDHLGLVAGFCQEIALAKRIDETLPSPSHHKKISYGKLVEAMLLNGLGFTGRTLHMYPDYFADKPVERLLGDHVQASDLNDDALGRCLDTLYEYGVSDMYQILGEAVVTHLGLPCESINIDTTSFHVDGEYVVDDDYTGIRLTRGYSRDHRPELNQVILNLITENQAGIPVYMQACSGNANDTETFKKLIKSHIKSLQAAQRSRYLIGDASLYAAEIIKSLDSQGQLFITRVPQKLREAKEVLSKRDGLTWIELENGYRAAWYHSDYADVRQQWLIVHSQEAQKREFFSLEKRINKSKQQSLQSFKKLSRQTFTCKADALNALTIWENRQDYIVVVNPKIEEEIKHAGRGRPKLGNNGISYYQITGKLECCATKRQKALDALGLFVLSTNDTSKKLTMQKMLVHYKSQQAVERGFRFLKSPDFLVSSLYLKKPERIEALLMIMTCCLMVYAALEYKIREALKAQDSYFPDMKNKPSQTPTARWVFQCFQGIHELNVGSTMSLIINLQERQKTIIQILGHIYQKIYS